MLLVGCGKDGSGFRSVGAEGGSAGGEPVVHADPRCPRTELAGTLTGTAGAILASPVIAIDPTDGAPVVAWSEDRTIVADVPAGTSLLVKKWTGSAWQSLGESVHESSGEMQIDLIVLDSGEPVVAWVTWSQEEVNAVLRVSRWDASREQWVGLGGILNTDPAARAEKVSLARGPSAEPVLAWSENSTVRSTAHLASWTGSAWSPFDETTDATGPLTWTPIAVNPVSGELWFAIHGDTIWIFRGAIGQPLSPRDGSPINGRPVDIEVGVNGAVGIGVLGPDVLWLANGAAEWAYLPTLHPDTGDPPGSYATEFVDIAIADGRPLALHRDALARFDGSNWTELCRLPSVASKVGAFAMTLDREDRPVVILEADAVEGRGRDLTVFRLESP